MHDNVLKLMVIVWAKVNRLLGNGPPETRIVHESTRRFPYEITEMIVAYLAHDLDALKACSLTCHSWRIATAPHVHHTILLRGDRSSVTKNWGMRLFKMYERGLMPLVIRVCASPQGFLSLVRAPRVQPLPYTILLRFHERPDTENSRYGDPPLYTTR
jgi:hypothetical protein